VRPLQHEEVVHDCRHVAQVGVAGWQRPEVQVTPAVQQSAAVRQIP